MLALIALGAPLVAALIAVPLAGRALADKVGARAGEALADALSSGEQAELEEGGEGNDESGRKQEELGGAELFPQTPSIADMSSRRLLAEAPSRASRRGLLVRADLVARAVKSGAQPGATPVPASGMRPEGLALYGVGGFGSGLRDGDVVTSIGGSPASSVGAAISSIAGAVRSGAKAISGVVWRGDEKLLVTVEIPPMAKLKRTNASRREP